MSSCRWELSFVPAMSKCCTGTVSNSFDPINPTNRQILWLRFFYLPPLAGKCRNQETLFSKRVVADFGVFCASSGISPYMEQRILFEPFSALDRASRRKYAPRALETGDLSPPEFNSDRQGLSRVSKWGLRLNLDPASAVRLTMRKEGPSSESYIEARILMLLVEIWFCIRIRFFVMVVINHRKEVCCYGEVVVVKLASDNILW